MRLLAPSPTHPPPPPRAHTGLLLCFRSCSSHSLPHSARVLVSQVCRDTHELRYICRQLFPLYLKPAVEDGVALTDARKLNALAQPHLRRALKSVYSRDGLTQEDTAAAIAAQHTGRSSLSADQQAAARGASSINPLGASVQLPTAAHFILLSGFLASRLPPRADVALFSSAPRKPGRRNSGPRNAKLSEVAHTFTLERLLAIYSSIAPPEPAAIAAATANHVAAAAAASSSASSSTAPITSSGVVSAACTKPPLRAELFVQVASLIDLRLFSRASKDSAIDCMRLRCDAPKELVASVAERLKFDLKQYEME
jgi:hypothetical protein